MALDNAGLVPQDGRRWRINDKVDHARIAAGELPPLTDSHPELWQRLCALYAEWEEVRHSLVHRTATVDTARGDFTGYDRTGTLLPTVTAAEQEQFARVAAETAAAVISDRLDRRDRNRLAWRLNQLAGHHHLTRLPDEAAPTNTVTVIVDLERLSDGRWRLDARKILARVRTTFPQAPQFDAECHAVTEGGDCVFECKLEEAPGVTDFELGSPPEWLQEVRDGG